MWCGYTCSPYQASFLQTHNGTGFFQNLAKFTNFTMTPSFAQSIYVSCNKTDLGGAVLGSVFPDWATFFAGFFDSSPLNPQSITFQFGPNGLSLPTLDCKDYCSCDTCEDACDNPPEVSDPLPEMCYVVFFGESIGCVGALALVIYMGLTFLLFVIASVYILTTSRFHLSHRKRIIFVLALAVVVAIALVGSWAGLRNRDCTIAIYKDYEWDCASAGLLAALLGTLWIAAFVLFLYLLSARSHAEHDPSVPQHSTSSDFHTIRDIVNSSTKRKGFFQRYFYAHGAFVARHPGLVVIAGLLVTGLFGLGILRIQVQEDPEKLWVSPGATTAVDEDFYNANFGPFWRIEQLIITSPDSNGNPTPILNNLPVMNKILSIQNQMTAIQVPNPNVTGQYITFEDLCYQPLPGLGCAIESVFEIWHSNATVFANLSSSPAQKVLNCNANPVDASCTSAQGIPFMPRVTLGGWNATNATSLGDATAIIITLLLLNYPENNTAASAWELEWLAIANQTYPDLLITYNAQVRVHITADIPLISISHHLTFSLLVSSEIHTR
jgi:hypothetical protein